MASEPADTPTPAPTSGVATPHLNAETDASKIVTHEGKEYEAVKEGLAYILTPREQPAKTQKKEDAGTTETTGAGDQGETQGQSVFYNPIQQFNRDLSVLAIRAHGEHVLAVKREKRERAERMRAAGKGGAVAGAGGKKRKRGVGDVGGREGENANGVSGEAKEEGGRTDTEPVPATETAPATNTNTTTPAEQKKPPPFTILDALSATGLRALRYAKEIPFTTRVVANDLSSAAIASMRTNIAYNNLTNTIVPNNADACAYMYSLLGPAGKKDTASAAPNHNPHPTHTSKFDVVDLDPYGTAAPFMDAAVQAVNDGGLLCVTCTDASVFASNGYPEKTYALYGGIPFKGPQSHEAGLRLILHALATSAAKYGSAIEPLLSLSIDFYARVFVRVHRSPAEVKFTAGKSMIVYNCDNGCGAWKTQFMAVDRPRVDRKGGTYFQHGFAQGPSTGKTCEHCGFKTHLAGPMWGGPLHNNVFIQRILELVASEEVGGSGTYETTGRIEGMLTMALEEDLEMGGDEVVSVPAGAGAGAVTDGKEPTASPISAPLIPRVPPEKLDPYPFFFIPSYLCKVLHTQTIPEDSLRGALHHLGYKSSRSHTKPGSVRTDAPWSVIWEIIREWVRQRCPVKEGKIREGTAGTGVMRRGRRGRRVVSGDVVEEDNVGRDDGAGARLRMLKRDMMAAVEGSTRFEELVVQVEAALYRAGERKSAVVAGAGDSGKQNGAESVEKEEKKGGDTAREPQKEATQQAVQQQQQQSRRQRRRNSPSRNGRRSPSPPRRDPDPSTLDIVFDEAAGRNVLAAHRSKRLTRYQMNPRANWGPMNRASVKK
ncbi:N2,N2-dimethylguanosine tRNA methyltransferase [Helicocarpus griseus UAMH5409]|uniref:tRNA (guanine(26)-N(2))-dimethyltransferase n=1 Tax=Helicocarpus griseus UAMH5409 TaxID=1447875 RepID=A0A2B7Y9C4_9EURO|nr:N2,N2-dimethylguanosine tRNA methyltransferase [Helicocarpus griseus UAMH5409]